MASGRAVTIRFREAPASDLVVLMPVATKASGAEFWVLYHADASHGAPPDSATIDLVSCPRCDEIFEPVDGSVPVPPAVPHVYVEVRWEGHTAKFPVRFEDKTRLLLLLAGRKPTQGELIDYFLTGREPDEGIDPPGPPGKGPGVAASDRPIDTRRILAYFIRRFVEAIPGIEAEVRSAAHSRARLDAALRGPRSPLALAECAFNSLGRPPASDEPPKTATAVGFQLVEILAALARCQAGTSDPELRECFDPVIAECQKWLNELVSQHSELEAAGFRLYREQVLYSRPGNRSLTVAAQKVEVQ